MGVLLAVGVIMAVAAAPAAGAQAGKGRAGPAARTAGAPSASRFTAVSGTAAAAAGTWRLLPAAPVATLPANLVSVWTGRQMIIHGTFGTGTTHGRVTFAYRPAAGTWKRLARGPAWMAVESGDVAVWTGSRMLVFGQTNGSYNPAANTWRPVPGPAGPASSVLGWTGRRVLMWLGGCCGAGSNTAAAYNPATSTWHRLPTLPLQPRFAAIGAWTGKELVVAGGLVGSPARTIFRDGAAYSPATGKWRKLAPMPLGRYDATAVWDDKEILFIGGYRDDEQLATRALAYNPATNHWRWLAKMPYPRFGLAAVWTGRKLLVWGGLTAANLPPPHGETYAPASNTWRALPTSPLHGRAYPTAVWTGRQMIVWGGYIPGDATPPTTYTDGAAYTPAR